MNTLPRPSPGQDFRHHEPSNSSSAESLPSFQHDSLHNMGARYHPKLQSFEEQTSSTPPSSELTTISLKTYLCPFCKGQKYGFTAYFHNQKIFPSPPHELLPLVEKSYILKNRLQSLLVTYIMRELEHGDLYQAEEEVLLWSQSVEDLLNQVAASALAFELSSHPLEEVRKWTGEMTRQICESVTGRKKLEMPKGKLPFLLLEFRKLWEAVWKQY